MGQHQETYRTLLVPVILDKLPAEMRKHLARDHVDGNWQLDELRRAVSRKISIIEAGNPSLHRDVSSF